MTSYSSSDIYDLIYCFTLKFSSVIAVQRRGCIFANISFGIFRMIWFSDKYFENYTVAGVYFGAFKLCHGSGSQFSVKDLQKKKK